MKMTNDPGCLRCPRKCGARRKDGEKGYCGVTDDILIARAAPHMWEEPCISGANGSGAVFFSGCSLHCCYCQNREISDGHKGIKVSINRLAEIFLELQAQNVYNINLVTPTHYSDQLIIAVRYARERGLTIPIVYNCSGYENVETVRKLENTVDIWMPDLKYISSDTSLRYSRCPDYFERAVEALDEMVRLVKKKGGLKKTEENGEGFIMQRGVIVRHMLLPDHVAESKRILRFLYNRYGNDIYISIMSQYTPMPKILENDDFPELKRRVTKDEYARLVGFAEKIGIENAFIQEGEVASASFIPAFDGEGVK